MTIATRSPHVPPKAPRLVLAILCVVALVGLTQCKMSADKVTGVSSAEAEMDKNKHERGGNCISKCSRAADKAEDREDELHEDNVDACDGNRDCLAAEKARHKAAEQQIEDDRRHCIDGCHHQGGGRGR